MLKTDVVTIGTHIRRRSDQRIQFVPRFIAVCNTKTYILLIGKMFVFIWELEYFVLIF